MTTPDTLTAAASSVPAASPEAAARSTASAGLEAGSTALLDHAGIAALIPHAGRMCLLDALLGWDATQIRCVAHSHRAPDHPLRSASGLLSSAAIEYAAQAMALHGALLAQSEGGSATPGYLASARGVTLHRLRLDDLPGALEIAATRQAGDSRQILYAFVVSHAGQVLAEGRAAVVLNTPLAAAGTAPASSSTPSP
jgi:predicted hotdog family 3-hydroxylacyl-ACP dehydratase